MNGATAMTTNVDQEAIQYSVRVGLYIVKEQQQSIQTAAALLRGRRLGISAKDCEGLAFQLERVHAELETARQEMKFLSLHLDPPKKPEKKPLLLVQSEQR